MKKIALLVVFLAATCITWAQDTDSLKVVKHEGPHLKFETKEHNFGAIPHKTKKIEYNFEFTNDGTAPVVITKTLTSCRCIKILYDKKPVMPGRSGVITVVYEVDKKESGVFYKVIEIYSNTADKRTNLVIKGNAVE